METENYTLSPLPMGGKKDSPSYALRRRLGRMLAMGLFAMGGLMLLAAAAYAAYAQLNNWLMEQEYYLIADDVAALPIPTLAWTSTPFVSPTVAASGSLSAEAVSTQSKRKRRAETPTPVPSRMVTARPTATLTPTAVLPAVSATPTAQPTSVPSSPPAKIRIPTLGVTRSIINLPRVRDRSSGSWTWNTNRLFRSGRLDLVGHSEGSASPGQEGNMILVGHNYGIGHNGVFVGLPRLRSGDKIQVVTKSGETFTYRVKTVKRVKWQRKNFAELTQHLNFLAIGGAERVTLVSCTGADFEPFPERIYVVADPVR